MYPERIRDVGMVRPRIQPCRQAQGREILASSDLEKLTAADAGVVFGAAGAVTLKGLAGTYVLHRVEWAL